MGVRTGSRRLQAMLEAAQREDKSTALKQAARAWLRQLKQIRRAAAPVRDLDVHRKLLAKMVGKPPHAPNGTPADPLCAQAEKLDVWLKNQRKHLAHGMQGQMKKRQKALPNREAAFFEAMGHMPTGKARTPRPAETVALEAFMRAVDAMPLPACGEPARFSQGYQEGALRGRIGCRGTGPTAALPKHSSASRDSIGDWHDWLCLSQEARNALGKDAPELNAFIKGEVERHFAAAMKTSQTMRGQLSGEWMSSHVKRPPASIPSGESHLASGF